MVTSYPAESLCRVTGPGVRKRGNFRSAPFSSSKVSVTAIALSIAVPQTSPSPCAAWVSPTENSPPATSTGSHSIDPFARSLMSRLPPTRRGGTTECSPGSARASPIVPVNGFSGTFAPGP